MRKRTMDLVQTFLSGSTGSGMLVKRSIVAGKLELFADVDVLVSED